MKKVIIQLWEISNDVNILSDGCSIHIDENNRNQFIKEKNGKIERIVGLPSEIVITDNIYEILLKEKSIRLSEIETNNLLGLKEIKPC